MRNKYVAIALVFIGAISMLLIAAVPEWIQYTERVVGENSPYYQDVVNRPMKQIWGNFTSQHTINGEHKSFVFPTPIPTIAPVATVTPSIGDLFFTAEHTALGVHTPFPTPIPTLAPVATVTPSAGDNYFTAEHTALGVHTPFPTPVPTLAPVATVTPSAGDVYFLAEHTAMGEHTPFPTPLPTATPLPVYASQGTISNFVNGWTSYGPSFTAAGYGKDGLGFVHLFGAIKPGANCSAAFTLPAEYRGYTQKNVPCAADVSGSNPYCYLAIFSNGAVYPCFGASAQWISLDGIVFDVIH